MPATAAIPTATEIVEALGVAGGNLDDEGRQIALTTYRLLADAAPVTAARIADSAGVSVVAVEAALDEWAGVFREPTGAVVGFWGLTRQPLDPEYRLDQSDGETLGYAWCAWDTLFLPTVLDRTLTVTGLDGLSGEEIRLTVSPKGVEEVDPAAAVVSFLAPEGSWEADVMTSFCHKVLFFVNQHNADRWIAEQADQLFTLSVNDAFEIGRRWTGDRYGHALTKYLDDRHNHG
jgi:alkylmercury lyase